MSFTIGEGFMGGWLLSQPLDNVFMFLFFFDTGFTAFFGLWLTFNLEKKNLDRSFKKGLERLSKKKNITIVEDQDKVISKLLSNQKCHYRNIGIFSIWPLLYVIFAQRPWISHRILLVIEIVSTTLIFVESYKRNRLAKKIIFSAMKH